ncbi:MAG: hypothetical protein ACYC1C_11695 [Chloroflexota bacterium]
MTKLLPSLPIIEVVTDANGEPAQLRWRHWRSAVAAVCNRWRVEDDWWRQEVARDYYKIRTVDGTLCVVFRDRQQGTWHLQRVYD